MGSGRRLELIEAECRRHAALAQVDAAHRAEHEEVAEALAWALRCLGKEEPISPTVTIWMRCPQLPESMDWQRQEDPDGKK